jgi:alkanesulfonate monooxygenase SsuD/methylene tetrahydromethanopterin reductase-like flavin-dependent oxidoreductase (luciferase family)
MLGSSDYGAQLGAYFGMPYCYAWFITDGRGAPEVLELYRHAYRPSALHPEPVSAICVWALVAETEEEARRQFWPRGRARLMRDKGVWGAIESPEAAAAHDYSDAERARIDQLRETHFVGTPEVVGKRLRALGRELKIDDLVVLTWAYDPAVSRRSYELLAQEFGLEARG